MARQHFYHTVWYKDPLTGEVEPLQGIEATPYVVNSAGVQGAEAVAFAARTGSTVPLLMTTNDRGVISFWLDAGDYNVAFTDLNVPARISDFTLGANSISGAPAGVLATQLPASVAAAISSIGDLQDSISTLESQIGGTSGSLSADIAAVANDVDDVEDDVTALTSTVAAQAAQIAVLSGGLEGDLETVVGQVAALSAQVNAQIKPGDLKAVAYTTAPAGWLLCDGTQISRATYSALFTAIGTAYGSGNGSSTFTLPNFKGRFVVGRDSAQTEFDTLGETGGVKTVVLSVNETPAHVHAGPSHSHGGSTVAAGTHSHGGATTTQQQNHTHLPANGSNFVTYSGGSAGYSLAVPISFSSGSTHYFAYTGGTSAEQQGFTHGIYGDGNHAHTINSDGTQNTSSVGGGAAHTNLPPFQVVNWLIKT